MISNALALEVSALSSIARLNFDDEFGLANAKDRLGIVSGKGLVSTSMAREDTDATMSVAISNLVARSKNLDRVLAVPGACLHLLAIVLHVKLLGLDLILHIDFLSNRSSLTGLAGS